MSWRRFGVLVSRLPVDSEYQTERRNNVDLSQLPPPTPGVHGAWPQTDMLLADIKDRLGDLIYSQGGYERPPARHPRPGVDNVTPINAESLAYLEYVRAHHGEHPPDDWTPDRSEA